MNSFESVATDKARIVTYCSHEMKRKLEKLADLRFRSVSNLIEAVLAEEIARAEANGELPAKDEQGK
jgi:predicted transcriptional regulator